MAVMLAVQLGLSVALASATLHSQSQKGAGIWHPGRHGPWSCRSLFTPRRGALFASTGCDSTPGCATALCPGVNGTCAPYRGPLGPRSLIEFTLQPNANDYFDISIINGVNVPVSMEPLLPSGHVWGPGVNVDPAYWCAAPGAATQPSGSQLAGCSWRFNASEVAQQGDAFASRIVPLVVRSPTPTPCSSDADCGGDMRCGLQMDTDPKGNPMASLSSTCGKPLGWWTADEVCAWTAAKPFGAPFDCAKATAQGPTYMDLYGCSGGVYGHSCYSQGATDTCCGCPDWPKLGIKAPAAQPCQNHNPVWAADALPAVAFLKRACPTAYSFPFDDLSSTFQCAAIPHAGSTNNTASYRISFCPGGATLF